VVSGADRPLVLVTGRRLGTYDRWPYTGASASPRGYQDSVLRAGGVPLLIDPVGDPTGILERVDALVLSGGPDVDPACYGQAQHEKTYGVHRDTDDFELALTHEALDRNLPTLAICRGFQILNTALGGTLYQHIPEHPGVEPHGRPGEPGGGRAQEMNIEAGTLLAKVMGGSRPAGTCHHHQAVDRVGRGLRVVARADDDIVEGLEYAEPDGRGWLLAVQWHPEDTAASDPANQRLFDTLVAEARVEPPEPA
jgi:gamma-glutamyl-gamma-aminobutyrate hydrolase PuuD